jgi:hypothetical protein
MSFPPCEKKETVDKGILAEKNNLARLHFCLKNRNFPTMKTVFAPRNSDPKSTE